MVSSAYRDEDFMVMAILNMKKGVEIWKQDITKRAMSSSAK